jgi:hypothetical protein
MTSPIERVLPIQAQNQRVGRFHNANPLLGEITFGTMVFATMRYKVHVAASVKAPTWA